MIQPSLFTKTIDDRFVAFHAENPRVYEALVRFTREARALGKTRFGIHAVWERVRWELWVTNLFEGDYKLNDHFTSRYARLIMEQEPDLRGIFETRRLRSA